MSVAGHAPSAKGRLLEPEFGTAEALQPTLAELLEREPIFHRRELVHDRESFERETAPDFWEVGASGRRYSREAIWQVLAERFEHEEMSAFTISDAQLRAVAPQTYLLTYTLDDGQRLTRRLTVWRGSAANGWKILFHQGTVVQERLG
jgi:hypothetical protein